VTDPDLIRLFVEPLEAIDISYMITGGVASVIYGDPRFTRDVDIVMELRQAKARVLRTVRVGPSPEGRGHDAADKWRYCQSGYSAAVG
jgi:hypothetical protein